jgi:hypothetical protein
MNSSQINMFIPDVVDDPLFNVTASDNDTTDADSSAYTSASESSTDDDPVDNPRAPPGVNPSVEVVWAQQFCRELVKMKAAGAKYSDITDIVAFFREMAGPFIGAARLDLLPHTWAQLAAR